MVEHKALLLLGTDESQKRDKLNSLKHTYLDKSLQDIDFETVYAQDKDLTPHKFDEVLSYPPSSKSKKRIVAVKNIEALSKENRDILLKRLNSLSERIILVLDSCLLSAADNFIKQLRPFVKIISFKQARKLNVFDLTQAIASGQTSRALKILSSLLKNREKPLNILGMLIWQWDNLKNNLSLDKFRQGLKILLETDIRIKTGRVREDLALEITVIRLAYLL